MNTKQLGNLKQIFDVAFVALILFASLVVVIMSMTTLLEKASSQVNSVVTASAKVSIGLAALVVLFSVVLPILRGTDEDEEEYRKKIRSVKFIEEFIFPWIMVLIVAVVILIYLLFGFTMKDGIFGFIVLLSVGISFIVAIITHKRIAKIIKERFFSP